MLKRLISSAVATVMLMAMVSIGTVSAAPVLSSGFSINENFASGNIPDGITVNRGTGNISVESYNGDQALFIGNEVDGAITMVEYNIGSISMGEAVFELDFCQPNIKSSGNIILNIVSGMKTIAEICTDENNIVASVAGSAPIAIVENYEIDTFYKIKASVDVDNKKVDVSVNDNDKISAESFEALGINLINKVYTAALTPPGIYIDNLSLYCSNAVGDITVDGNLTQLIPLNGINKFNYTASIKNYLGQELNDTDFMWKLGGEYSGVTLSKINNKTAQLFISSTAATGNIIIEAYTKNNPEVFKSITVNLAVAQASEVKVTGSAHVSYYKNNKEFKYEAEVYDSDKNLMINEDFVWSVDNRSSATLNFSEDGTLWVSGNLPKDDEYATIKARLKRDSTVYGEKKIVIQGYDTYFSDIRRLEIARQSVDYILKYASNQNGTNPLIAGYLSPYTNKVGEIRYRKGDNVKYTNFTENFQLYRSMTALSNLEGDESYKDRVYKMYNYALDNMQTANGLFYWGNHQSFDLDTGKRTQYYELYDTDNYYEVENRDIYDKPFLDIDPDTWIKHYKSHWVASIQDWSTLVFNRHSLINSAQLDYSKLSNMDVFKPGGPDDPFVKFRGLTFMSTGVVLLNEARVIYEQTGDANMLEWAKRLVYQYLNTANKNTGMFGAMFVTSHNAPGTYSLDEEFPEGWWKSKEGVECGKLYNYGDRAYNQFAQLLVDKGVIDESQMDEILECNMLDTRIFSGFASQVFKLAEAIGLNNDEAKMMAIKYFKGLVATLDYAYDESTNKLNRIFTNGANITGITWTRGGYWGSAGKSFPQIEMPTAGIIGLMDGYIATENYSEISAEREKVWEFIRSYMNKKYLIGDIGYPEKGIEPKLNVGISCNKTEVIRVLLKLFDSTQNYDYIRLARVIANNLINSEFKGGMFISDEALRYIPTECEEVYVILALEEKIRKENSLVPESYMENGFEHQIYSYSSVNNALLEWTNPELLTLKYPDVYVTDIVPEATNITMKAGETYKINVNVLPDDAAVKSIFWEVSDRSTVRIDENNNIYARKRGTVYLTAVSKSSTGVKSEAIKVVIE